MNMYMYVEVFNYCHRKFFISIRKGLAVYYARMGDSVNLTTFFNRPMSILTAVKSKPFWELNECQRCRKTEDNNYMPLTVLTTFAVIPV